MELLFRTRAPFTYSDAIFFFLINPFPPVLFESMFGLLISMRFSWVNAMISSLHRQLKPLLQSFCHPPDILALYTHNTLHLGSLVCLRAQSIILTHGLHRFLAQFDLPYLIFSK